MPHSQPHRRGALAAAVFVLFMLAILPGKWGGWMNWFGSMASMIAAPVTAPVHSALHLITPPPGAPSEEVGVLRNEADKWKQLYLQAQVENESLRRQFDRLGSNVLPEDTGVAP